MESLPVLVTIITVCYNSEKTIEQTIQSVLNQSYSNLEYIIVDGGSTDRTIEIIKRYEMVFEGRLHWISEKDQGIYDAMNKGIKMASGEIIGIINSDDFYELDAVEQVMQCSKECPYQILYGFTRAIRNGIEDTIFILSPQFLKERMISHPSCFISRKVYERFGAYDVRYKSVADYDFMLRVKDENDVVFIPVYKLITNFRTGGMSSTREAYLDLVELQKNYQMISKWKYIKIRILDILKKDKGDN